MKKIIVTVLILIATVSFTAVSFAAPKYYVDNDGYVHTPGIVSINGPEFNTSNYSNNFNTTHAAAVAAGGYVVIDSASNLTTNVTITTSVPVVWGGGTITKTSGSRLHLGGGFDAPDKQVFIGFSAGDVTFDDESGISPNVYWWGAKGDDATDSYAAIQSAIDSVSSDVTGTVVFTNYSKGINAKTITLPNGKYKISDTISIPTGVIFDGSNSVITQTTAGKDGFYFRFVADNGYYGTFRGGLRNVVLDGGGVGRYGVHLDVVNWSDFSNIHITRFETGMLLWETQYSTFSQIGITQSSVDGLVLTYHPDRPLLTCIDNSFSNIAVSWSTRYGIVLHAARYNTFVKIDASRNLTADIVVGGTLYNAVKGLQVSNNDFFGIKAEHNRDDAPTSGYAILVSYGNDGVGGVSGNTFTNLSVTRSSVGTTYDQYFKWLYNGGFNTIVNNPYDYTTASGGGNWVVNPAIPGDYSIFRVATYSGLIVNYGSHWQQNYIHDAATDATDTSAGGSSQYSYTYFDEGSFAANGIYVKDAVQWGGDINARLYRTSSGVLRSPMSIKSDIALYGGSIRSTLFSTENEDEAMIIQPRTYTVSGGGDLIALTTRVTSTGAVAVYKVAPVFDNGTSTGTNAVFYSAPTYSAVGAGTQYHYRAQESGATAPQWGVERKGFIMTAPTVTTASVGSFTPTAPISRITGTTTINTIFRPVYQFYGDITLIPDEDSDFKISTSGNVAVPIKAIPGQAIKLTYDDLRSKWYPTGSTILSGLTGTIGGVALATAGTCSTGTATVTGAVSGMPVVVSTESGALTEGLIVVSASVTATNTVSVQECAIAAVTPAARRFYVRVLR